jgi:hypothetical protein
MTVPCPTCRQPSDFTASNPHRPFCSERCRLLDLGAWLDEQYAVPGELAHDEASQAGPGATAPTPRPEGAEES